MKIVETPRKNRKGSILLLTLGVLALLSLLGTALIFMSRSDQQASRDFMEKTRAQFAADSGIETALAKLRSTPEPLWNLAQSISALPATPTCTLEYTAQSSWGTDDLDGDGFKETAGVVSETHSKGGDSFKLRAESTQGKLNINDSNDPVNEDSDPFEDQLRADRDWSSVDAHMKPRLDMSNWLSAPCDFDPDWLYPGQSDYVATLGGGLPYPKAPGRLENIVKELLAVLFPSHPDPEMPGKAAQTLLLARKHKYGGNFQAFHEIHDTLHPAFLTSEQAKLFESHLCLHSWQDDSVLLPNFQWRVSRPPVDPEFYPEDIGPEILWNAWGMGDHLVKRPRFGKIIQPLEFTLPDGTVFVWNQPPPAWDEDNDNSTDIYVFSDAQTKYFELTARSPVDVNSAPQTLLEALLRPLSGWQLKEAPDAGQPATAEDWSVPNEYANGNIPCHHMWFVGRDPRINQTVFPGVDTWIWGYLPLPGVDECNYTFFDETMRPVGHYNGSIANPLYPQKNARFGELVRRQLSADLAKAVAAAIYGRVHGTVDGPIFSPFLTWEEFQLFVRELADDSHPSHIPGMTRDLADLLIANFNPNARINDFNPNKTFYIGIDKSQLIENSTEFCFSSMGIFDLRALGLVKNTEDQTMAKYKVRVTAGSGLEILKLTTQAQFMEGYAPLTGGLQGEDFFGESNDVSNTSGLGFSGGAVDPAYKGHCLLSFPEPELPLVNLIKDSHFDGYLTLALSKPNHNQLFYETPGTSFHADFKGTLDAAHSLPGLTLNQSDPDGGFWINDPFGSARLLVGTDGETMLNQADSTAMSPRNKPKASKLARGWKDLWPLSTGNLYPDGAFSDAGHALGYDARSFGDPGVGGRVGGLCFWLKPGFDMAHANRVRQFFTFAPKNTAHYTVLDYMDGYPLSYDADNTFWGKEFAMYYFAHGGPRATEQVDVNAPVYSADLGSGGLCTRSLFVHNLDSFAQTIDGYNHPSMNSCSVNHSWRSPSQTPSNPVYYNMESRQWSHISLSWNMEMWDALPDSLRLTVNGQRVEEDRLWKPRNPIDQFQLKEDGTPNYARFGESSSAPFRNLVADSTYDDIASSQKYVEWNSLLPEFAYGRYDSLDAPEYQSPAIDLFAKLGNKKANNAWLKQLSWTAYLPNPAEPSKPGNAPSFNDMLNGGFGNSFANFPAPARPGKPGEAYAADPSAGHWKADIIPFSFDIEMPNSNKWYYENKGVADPKEKPCFAGGAWESVWEKDLLWKRGETFRFKMHFNLIPGSALLASPILDDVSIFFQTDENQILQWENDFEE